MLSVHRKWFKQLPASDQIIEWKLLVHWAAWLYVIMTLTRKKKSQKNVDSWFLTPQAKQFEPRSCFSNNTKTRLSFKKNFCRNTIWPWRPDKKTLKYLLASSKAFKMVYRLVLNYARSGNFISKLRCLQFSQNTNDLFS